MTALSPAGRLWVRGPVEDWHGAGEGREQGRAGDFPR